MKDPTHLQSSPTGRLQPPITWAQLPTVIQQAILNLPSDQWQRAIDQFAAALYWYMVREMHEAFLAKLRQTQPAAGDTWEVLIDKFQQHQELLRWHHYTLHPNEDRGDRPEPAFQLKDQVEADSRIGKIVGLYWQLWGASGWSYLVEWDEVTGDGNYYAESAIKLNTKAHA